MINFFKIYFFLSFSLSGTFDILSESPTVYIDDLQINKPFLGGFNSPRIQWVDWDDDMENELFVLDEDGCLRAYDYIIPEDDSQNPFFNIIDTSYYRDNVPIIKNKFIYMSDVSRGLTILLDCLL